VRRAGPEEYYIFPKEQCVDQRPVISILRRTGT
jgi:hypothetical protein